MTSDRCNDRVDFSQNASIYDRRHGAAVSDDVVRRLAAAAALEPGVRLLDIGAGTTLGFVRSADVPIGPGPSLTLAEFLRRLTAGEFSYIWNVPAQVQAECLPRLQRWAERTFNLDASIAMPRELRWSVYRKNGHGIT